MKTVVDCAILLYKYAFILKEGVDHAKYYLIHDYVHSKVKEYKEGKSMIYLHIFSTQNKFVPSEYE